MRLHEILFGQKYIFIYVFQLPNLQLHGNTGTEGSTFVKDPQPVIY